MEAQTAKVFVWKDTEDEPQYQWKVGSLDGSDLLVVAKEFPAHAEAWEWLYKNYKRETP
jgi:hypothetical protein